MSFLNQVKVAVTPITSAALLLQQSTFLLSRTVYHFPLGESPSLTHSVPKGLLLWFLYTGMFPGQQRTGGQSHSIFKRLLWEFFPLLMVFMNYN